MSNLVKYATSSKIKRQKYGKLSLKNTTQDFIQWDVVQIDTMEQYIITSSEGKIIHLSFKTMIYPSTGRFEIHEMKDTNDYANAARIFNNIWLSRYSRPRKVIIYAALNSKNISNLYLVHSVLKLNIFQLKIYKLKQCWKESAKWLQTC